MAFWIEIHCDARETTDLGEPNCVTVNADNPGILVDSQNKHILKGANTLRENARKKGWKRTKYGWACHVCSTRRRVKHERI